MKTVVISILTFIPLLTYCSIENANDTFLYYAYGSNLLAKRIHIQNPSAKFYNIGKLENYRLDFNLVIKSWNGAVATICEDPGSSVWGALWTIGLEDLPHIDEQEGVNRHWYYPTNITVTTPEGQQVTARVYIQVHNPRKLMPGEITPLNRRPSITYRKVIYYGAIECGIPQDYIDYIYSFPTNGRLASCKVREELGSLFYD